MIKLLFAIAMMPQIALADICKDYGDRAEEIMTLRQNNDAMSGVIARVGHNALLKELVMAAYAHPLMQVAENKKEMISEFRNDREYLCYKSFGTQRP